MAAPYSYNPFFGPPPPDPNDPRAVMNQVVQDSMARPRAAMFGGPPLLSPEDLGVLENAPRILPSSPRGTTVKIEAYPVPESFGHADHMYADYDDGQTHDIYRGGDRVPWLHAQVDPSVQSPDFEKGERTLYQTFLPRVSADDAVQAARADAQQNNDAWRLYGYDRSNSNSLMGDFTQRQFGHRVGDKRTWGYDTPLGQPAVDPIPPGMYRPTNPIW